MRKGPPPYPTEFERRDAQLRKKKRSLSEQGLYPLDFVMGVLNRLSTGGPGFEESSVKSVIQRLGERNSLEAKHDELFGLILLKKGDVFALVDYFSNDQYRGRNKISHYTEAEVRSVIVDKMRTYFR